MSLPSLPRNTRPQTADACPGSLIRGIQARRHAILKKDARAPGVQLHIASLCVGSLYYSAGKQERIVAGSPKYQANLCEVCAAATLSIRFPMKV